MRRILFWIHLGVGLGAGVVIAVVAATGSAMAFRPQILAWADRGQSRFSPSEGHFEALPLDKVLAKVRERFPEARAEMVTLTSDLGAGIIVTLGRQAAIYVNPFTGEIHPQGAAGLRRFFQWDEQVHRSLTLGTRTRETPGRAGNAVGEAGVSAATDWRKAGSSIVGSAAGVLFFLSLTGLILWWPKSFSRRALKPITAINRRLRGKARDWNWHNSIGFWISPWLLVITFTGSIMAFESWAAWIYRGVPHGLQSPAQVQVPLGASRLSPDEIFACATKEFPEWGTLTLRLQARGPRGGGGQARDRDEAGRSRGSGVGSDPGNLPPPVASRRVADSVIVMARPKGWSLVATTLEFDPFSGALLKRSGVSNLTFPQAMRALNKPLHTGEAFGIMGQSASFITAVGTLFLVYTGFALSWRRFFGSRKNSPVEKNLKTEN